MPDTGALGGYAFHFFPLCNVTAVVGPNVKPISPNYAQVNIGVLGLLQAVEDYAAIDQHFGTA